MPTYPTHDEVRSLGDFAMYHKWNIHFIKLPQGLSLNSDELNLRAISSDMPKTTIDVSTTQIRGHEVHQAGIRKYNGTIQMTLVEGITSDITNFIHEWKNLCWEINTGIQRLKSEYEGTLLITPCDHAHKERSGYTLIGVWLEDFDHGSQLDGSNSDSVKPVLTFRYDYYKPFFPKIGASPFGSGGTGGGVSGSPLINAGRSVTPGLMS